MSIPNYWGGEGPSNPGSEVPKADLWVPESDKKPGEEDNTSEQPERVSDGLWSQLGQDEAPKTEGEVVAQTEELTSENDSIYAVKEAIIPPVEPITPEIPKTPAELAEQERKGRDAERAQKEQIDKLVIVEKVLPGAIYSESDWNDFITRKIEIMFSPRGGGCFDIVSIDKITQSERRIGISRTCDPDNIMHR
jgi:hypothetical protein